MALIRCDFFSEALGMGTLMTVLLPDHGTAGIGVPGAAADGDPPVLYLLHGLTDDDTVWTRRTAIERYVAPLGLAVVMPQVQRSFYCDEAHGNRYWTFLSEELPEVCRSFFRLSTRREDTFVAGLSMGGYLYAGQCSGLQAGGEGPRWEGRQGPGSALDRAVLLLDVLLRDDQRSPADGAREVRTRPQLVGPVVVPHEVGELLPQSS